jgi:hypothetical protein
MEDKKLSQEALKVPIEGLNLQAGTLGEQLGSETQLLVFLRHLG